MKDEILKDESFRNYSETQRRTLRQLLDHEGLRLTVYRDTEGYLTGGVGHLIMPDEGFQMVGDAIPERQVVRWLRDDFEDAQDGALRYYPKLPFLSPPRWGVLVGMCFNLGAGGLFRFVKLREALLAEDWRRASLEMVDSLWAGRPGERGVGLRAWKMAAQMRLNRWI
jgi:lysozyme